MRAADVEAVFSAREPGDKSNLDEYVRALADAGVAVLYVEPNGKAPLDLRTPQAKAADNRAAQERAKAAGIIEWGKAKQPAGVYLATTDTARLADYAATADTRYGVDTVNLGVAVGPSGLVVVDADTPAEVDGFKAAWKSATDTDLPRPTVRSPGQIGADGAAYHHDGGHWYFSVPEGASVKSYEDATGWVAKAGGYVVIPPSVRAEGPYEWVGEVHELPAWLLDRLTVDHAETAGPRTSGPIDEWAAAVEWPTLLDPRGWTRKGVESCGCDTWTRPGDVSAVNSKSAVTHGPSCDKTDDGHMHVWSDSTAAAWGTRNVSKLQFVAHVDHEGDVGAATAALGIPYSDGLILGTGEPLDLPTASTDPHDPALMAEVFGYSPVTAHILEQARVRLVGPWSALAVALVHACVLAPWWVRLPAFVGGEASLNAVVALVGGSGAGKGASAGATPMLAWAYDPLDSDDALAEARQTVDTALVPITVGSGEAIATLFRDWREVPVTHTDAKGKQVQRTKKELVTVRRTAWLDFSEVDQVAALMRRESSTLSAELRKLWDGKNLGVHTKSVERRSEVQAFEYRAAVTIGVQPERAEALLSGEDGGLPQRLLWVSTSDPAVPDEDEGAPATLSIPAPPWGRVGDGTVTMGVSEAVGATIRADRRAVLRGAAGALVGIDAHRNLVRLKLAAAVAVLHSRADVSDEDWHLAGLVLVHSDRVRAEVRRSLAVARRDAHEARGASDAYRAEGERATRDKAVETAAAGAHAWLAKRRGQAFTASKIRDACKTGSTRHLYCAEALDVLVDEGSVRHGEPSRTNTATFEWNADRAVES